MKKVEKNIIGSYDIFTDILSQTIFQSGIELVDTLIDRSAKEEWQSLSMQDASILSEASVLKSQIRDDIRNMLERTVRYPTLMQKFIRLQTQMRTLNLLGISHQDRIIAKEIGLKYADWKKLLGFLGLYREIGEALIRANTMHVKYTDHTENDILLQIRHSLELTEDIAGVYKEEYPVLSLSAQPNGIILEQNIVSILYIEQGTLARTENILGGEDIHESIRNKFGYIRTYKKKSFGNKPKKEQEDGKIAWNR